MDFLCTVQRLASLCDVLSWCKELLREGLSLESMM